MKNMPKVIGTGEDIYNLLGMVQAGKLSAEQLKEAIEGIEAELYINVPMIAVSEDKRYVTVNYLAEAVKGNKAICNGKTYTIKSVEHVTVEQEDNPEESQGENRTEEKRTIIGVDKDVEETAEKIGVASPTNILEELGITQAELESVKGVLAKYE